MLRAPCTWPQTSNVIIELSGVKTDLVLCYKIIFDIVHLNKHDFLIYPLSRGINLKYTSVLTVVLSDHISFVKELLRFGI